MVYQCLVVQSPLWLKHLDLVQHKVLLVCPTGGGEGRGGALCGGEVNVVCGVQQEYNNMMLEINNHLVIYIGLNGVKAATTHTGVPGAFPLVLSCSRVAGYISVIHVCQPAEQDGPSIAKHSVNEELKMGGEGAKGGGMGRMGREVQMYLIKTAQD